MTQKCWIITDGSMGMEKQCIALAEALGVSFDVKRIEVKPFWRFVPPALWFWPMRALKKPLKGPWPSMIITCGHHAIAPSLWIKKQNFETFVLKIQNPRVLQDEFDLIITPQHDLIEKPNILKMPGSIHNIDDALLKAEKIKFEKTFAHLPKPHMGMLIGGSQKGYRLTETVIDDLMTKAKHFCDETGGSLLITISRRTQQSVRDALMKKLEGLPHFFWQFEGENPYLGILACADVIVPTADSINMCTEAAASGKPVYVYHYGNAPQKFARFHDMMQREGYAYAFDGHVNLKQKTKKMSLLKNVALDVQNILKKRGLWPKLLKNKNEGKKT